jgi:regulator of nucleoside diphosphate kinase
MSMQEQQIHDNTTITLPDEHRLRRLLFGAGAASADKEHLDDLEQQLDSARVVDSGSIPADVVTLDSRVRIRDLRTGEDSCIALVMPRDADITKGAIAITAPLGRAMFGRKAGDVLRFITPGGVRSVKIVRILYQPEADGAQQRPREMQR